jgi:hypothetical protein
MFWKKESSQTVHPIELAPASFNPDPGNSGTKINRNTCISWSWNIVVAVAAIVLLLFASLDEVQTAMCLHNIALCITCAVLVWMKHSSRNWFIFSILFTGGHFLCVVVTVWNCEPLFYGAKMWLLIAYLLGVRMIRIGGSRLVRVVEGTPKALVRFTYTHIFLAASMVLVASLHLAFRSLGVFLFAETALWGCCIVDTLWHFGVWNMNMKRAFRFTERMNSILSKNNSALQYVNMVRRRQYILNTVSILFTETICMACIIYMNLQEGSKECSKRTSIGSDRIALFLFSFCVAVHIAPLMIIHMHTMSKRRDKKRLRPVVPIPESSLISCDDSDS